MPRKRGLVNLDNCSPLVWFRFTPDGLSAFNAKIGERKADSLRLIRPTLLVFLPTYSPDLNPIEYIWKSIKRVLSLVFVETLQHMKDVISNSWETFSKSLSYASSWIDKFLVNKIPYSIELCG